MLRCRAPLSLQAGKGAQIPVGHRQPALSTSQDPEKRNETVGATEPRKSKNFAAIDEWLGLKGVGIQNLQEAIF
jgi:hypothetical protein